MSIPQESPGTKSKLPRVLGIVIGVIAIAGAFLFFLLNHYINSDALKARAVALIAESTGRELTVDGKISLSLFPRIALTTGPARISNPPEFSGNEFASVESIRASLDLKELFSKNIRITSLQMDGLSVHLQKNKDGKGNWDFKPTRTGRTPASRPAQKPASDANRTNDAFLGIPGNLKLDEVNITDANVLFENAESGATISAQDLNLEIHDFGLGREARVALRSDVLIPNKNARIPVSLESRILLSSNGAVDVSSLGGHVGDTAFKGSVKGIPGDSYEIDAVLALDDLDLNTYLSLIKENTANSDAGAFEDADKTATPDPANARPSTASAERTSGKAVSGDGNAVKDFLSDHKVRLNLEVRSLTVDTVRVEKIKALAEAHKGIIRVKPFDCLAFKGTLGGEALADINASPLKSSVNLTLLGADISECARLFSEKRDITGTLDATVNLSASGQTKEEIERSVSGSISASASNGVIYALRLLPQAKLDGGYRRCSFSAKGDAGRFSSSDISLDANGVSASGSGWIDLPSRTLDAKIRVEVPKLSIIPVRIVGSFDTLQVTMDAATTITSTILNIGGRIHERRKQKETGATGQNETNGTRTNDAGAKNRPLENILRRVLK